MSREASGYLIRSPVLSAQGAASSWPDGETGSFGGRRPGSPREPRSQDPSRFAYTRIYCTPDTETHFENVTVALSKTNVAPPAAPGYAGGNRPVSTALFVAADAHWDTHDLKNRLNHPAPAPQFVVVLDGVFSVTTTDGEMRRGNR